LCTLVGANKELDIINTRNNHENLPNLSCIVDPPILTVNFLRSSGYDFHHSDTFRAETEKEAYDLPYFTVKWLSRNSLLSTSVVL